MVRKRFLVMVLQSNFLGGIFRIVNVFWLCTICFGGSVIILSELHEWWHYILYVLYHLPIIYLNKTQQFMTKISFRDFHKESEYYKQSLLRNLKESGLIK